MKKTREQKGITLIALIITIVVLLILAVVAIRAIQGDGILQYAEKAASDYEEGQNNESSILDHYLGLIDESQSDLIVHKDVIPEGGVYTSADGTVYNAGEKFPETTTVGDIYEYGDYKYTLNKSETSQYFETLEEGREYYKEMVLSESEDFSSWDEVVEYLESQGKTEEMLWAEVGLTEETFYGSWSVKVNDKTKTEYGAILEKVNGRLVTSMNDTFMRCTSLTTAPTIPSSVTSMVTTFYGCTSLTIAPVIPDSVTNMGGTFYNCTSLITAPTIPSGVTTMYWSEGNLGGAGVEGSTNYYGCFQGCTSLTTAPEIPSNVTDMRYVFYGCTSLTTAPTIPSSVTGMSSTFYGCTSLTTAPTIPSSVTDMSSTFEGCTSLTTAPTIPSSVTGVSRTFYGCTSLTTAPTIPSGVTNMSYTFYNCTVLTGEIEINANPTNYGWCFEGTTKDIKIVGLCTEAKKAALAATATNGNVTY